MTYLASKKVVDRYRYLTPSLRALLGRFFGTEVRFEINDKSNDSNTIEDSKQRHSAKETRKRLEIKRIW